MKQVTNAPISPELKWCKLKAEGGRAVLGSRAYPCPEGTGCFVVGEQLKRTDPRNIGGQVSLEHIACNGVIESYLCYHGQDRFNAWKLAEDLFYHRAVRRTNA